MRTIRNVTFAVLCALVFMTPAKLLGASCDIYNTWENCYAGTCTNCNEAWTLALSGCGWPNGNPEGFYCGPDGEVRFCCVPIIID